MGACLPPQNLKRPARCRTVLRDPGLHPGLDLREVEGRVPGEEPGPVAVCDQGGLMPARVAGRGHERDGAVRGQACEPGNAPRAGPS